MIDFIAVNSRMANVCFSRRGILHVANQRRTAPIIPSTQTMHRVVFGDRRHDVLLLAHVSQIPKDVQEAFSVAERINSEQFQSLGPNFSEDLAGHCDFIGFATHLEAEYEGRRETVHGFGIDILRRRTEGTKENKGDTPKDICLGSILADNVIGEEAHVLFVVVRDKGLDLGRLSLAVLIAQEVGILKILAQAKKLGVSEENLSQGMVKFFANAYAYNFILCLLAAADETNPTGLSAPNNDMSHIIEWQVKCFHSVVEGFLNMNPLQRKYFIGMGDVRGLSFGLPVFVEFIGVPQRWGPPGMAESQN